MALPNDRLMDTTEVKQKIAAGDLKQKSGSTLPPDSPLCPDFDTMDDYVDLDKTTYVNNGYRLDRCATLGKLEFQDFINLGFTSLSEFAKIKSPNIIDDGMFGYNVSISGDGSVLIAGQPDDVVGATTGGAAYLYRFNGTSWVLDGTFTSANVGDRYGLSVHMSKDGTLAFIGGDESNVTVLKYTTSWNVIQTLTGTSGDGIGASIDLSDDNSKLIIGCLTIGNTGGIYAYDYNGSSFVNKQTVYANGASNADHYSFSAAISGDGSTFIMGGPLTDAHGTSTGSAEVFTHNGSSWVFAQKLEATDADGGDQFGWSVAISYNGSFIAIGARYEDSSVSQAGKVYTFRDNGSSWVQEDQFQPNVISAIQYFGSSLSMNNDGTLLAVGATEFTHDGVFYAGAVYIFSYANSTWTQEQILVSSTPLLREHLGWSVATSSDFSTIVSGAYEDDTTELDSGAIYIFKS